MHNLNSISGRNEVALLTLYAESKKTDVRLRIAALLNAGVSAFLCLLVCYYRFCKA